MGFIGGFGYMSAQYEFATREGSPVSERDIANQYIFWALVFGVCALLFLFLITVGYDHLVTAVGVLDASADFLASTKRIFIVPTVYLMVSMILGVLFMYSMLGIS